MSNSSLLDILKKPTATVSRKPVLAPHRRFDTPGGEQSAISNPLSVGASPDFGSVALGSVSTNACPLATPRTCPFGGACHSCPTRVQAKLEVGAADDEYEREADRVADEVMRMPEPTELSVVSGQQSVIGGRPSAISRQLSAVSGQPVGIEVRPEVEAQIQNLRGSGQPLSASERAFFEPRFGHDFSKVHIHADARAAEAARSVNAKAFTVGQDVVFGAEQHTPRSESGQVLLAHELAHTVQRGRQVIRPKSGKEEEKGSSLTRLEKYGWWCGPGNACEIKKSHCKDVSNGLDRCCCKHDKDYEHLNVYVSDEKPGKVKWTSSEGLARTAAADSALVACSSLAVLGLWRDLPAQAYQVGIQTIFGSRAAAGYVARGLDYGSEYKGKYLSPSRDECDKYKVAAAPYPAEW
jgi:hypothetical protein